MSSKLLLLLIILTSILPDSTEKWRSDRQPKIMGNKIPVRALQPNRKPVQRRIVFFHNFFRTRVEPPAANMLRMKWHKGVAKAAQKWAEQCMLLVHDDVVGRHIDNYGSCGQNIFVSSHQVPWLFAIKTWWLERDSFSFGGDNNDLLSIGHYTQMVWATTHEVGCGFHKCDRVGNRLGKSYYSYVCNYCPIGNSPGKIGTPYIPGTPCSECENYCKAGKLCTNVCYAADYWVNCKELFAVWPSWLCNTNTDKGKERFNACKATCRCKGKIYD